MEHREATPDDFPHLIRLTYPMATPGSALYRDVLQEWRWLWRTDRFMTVAIFDRPSGAVFALMGAIMLTEEFYQRLCRAEHPYVNRRLGREPQPGDAPLVDSAAMVDGSATLFWNYFAWEARGRAPEEAAVLRGELANAFLALHGGYAFARIAVEVVGTRILELTLRTGTSVVNDYALWSAENAVPDLERPYLMAIDRRTALATENHWYSRAFTYHPPILGLGLGQREVLRLACRGMTDVQIAGALSVGNETVKKRWESIYDRFYERLPGMLMINPDGKRGGEKRRIVIGYVQTRMEEIRP